jgi:hypothetical protein
MVAGHGWYLQFGVYFTGKKPEASRIHPTLGHHQLAAGKIAEYTLN